MQQSESARHLRTGFPLVTLVIIVVALATQFPATPTPPWVWAAFSLAYVSVALRSAAAADAAWPLVVAMAAALDSEGALLAGTITVGIGVLAVRLRSGERFLPRFVCQVGVVALFLAVVAPAGESAWVTLLGGAVAGVALYGFRSAFRARDLPAARWNLAGRALEHAAVGAGAALLGWIVTQAGDLAVPVAVAGALMLVAVEWSRADLRAAHRDAIDSLLRALEAKDLYTRGHAERVARYSVAAGADLGLEGRRLRALERAALLHDIGKVVTPRHLLRKPGRLTEREYCRIQHHADVVPQVLDRIGFLRPLVDVISEHHRHFDGSGYGSEVEDELSLEARILAVADGFDAMTTHRPYRRALSADYAISELRRCSGTQFDPAVVEAFVASIEQHGLVPPATGVSSDEVARRTAEEFAHV